MSPIHSARLFARPLLVLVSLIVLAAAPAAGQRVPFERTFDVPAGGILDVQTMRGAIDVAAGPTKQVIVRGTATVRLGFNVPVNAIDLVRRVAANPPVRQEGATVFLRPPTTDEEQRAMTISYRVTVPAGTEVRSETDSAATAVNGVTGRVTVRTQSGAVDLRRLGGSAEVDQRSGAVLVDDVVGDLVVTTASGAITLRQLGGGLRLRTQSGGVDVRFARQARGQVDVETSSSGIDLVGVTGALAAASQSGHIRASGVPRGPWDVSVGSSSIELLLDRESAMRLEMTSGSGDVYLKGITLADAAIVKGSAVGTVRGGGPLVRASTRSGSVRASYGR